MLCYLRVAMSRWMIDKCFHHCENVIGDTDMLRTIWCHNLILGLTSWVKQLSAWWLLNTMCHKLRGKFSQSLSLPQSQLHSIKIYSRLNTYCTHIRGYSTEFSSLSQKMDRMGLKKHTEQWGKRQKSQQAMTIDLQILYCYSLENGRNYGYHGMLVRS